jgi:peptide/nickel transport system substrate-binding protein
MEDMDHETGEGFFETAMTSRLTRRSLARRAAIMGVSVPAVAALIAACGSDDDESVTTAAPGDTAAAGVTTGASAAPGETTAPDGTDAPATSGGTIRVAAQKPAGPLDPIAMVDLGSYGVIAQCFEYLCTIAESDIGPGLATEWTPNDDSTEWTFTLREGVTWSATGNPFTSADVVATMERIATGGDGLGGAIVTGNVTAVDDLTVLFTLASPNASLPYLVSVYNPQSAITPADYELGTTLDGRPDGTGPWILSAYDPTTGASYVRNDTWWGGKTPLDGADWQFFADASSMVTAMQGKSVDAIVQFSVVGGDALFNDDDFEVISMRAATHREIWMNCTDGQFTDKRVRQALALCIDRDALVETLFAGQAETGNDHPIAPLYPFFSDAVTQRTRDTDAAKALLADAGFPDGIKATLNAVDLQEIPQLAELIQIQAAEGGFDLEINVESGSTFYDTKWCQSYPCAGSAELGIVDYGHRATPDIYLLKAFKSGGDWNSSQYKSDELDAAILEYQSTAELEGRTAACEKIETILNEDVPAVIPYFYNYIGGHSKSFTGVRLTALGQMFLDQAAAV